jgi:acetyl esterase
MSSLDPQTANLLDELKALCVPSFSDLSVAGARKLHADVFKHEASDVDLKAVQELRIPGNMDDVPIRIYRPYDDQPLPIVVFAHGGGWILGDLDNHDHVCRLLARESGCLLVSVDYRLAPEHPFPAALEDIFSVVKWVADRGDVIGGDPDRIAIAGDSSGGNLSAAVALMDRERGLRALSHQALIYPATDYAFDTDSYHENAEGYFLTREDMRFFWNHYLTKRIDRHHPYASPLRAPDLSGLPSTTIVTAEFDPLRDDGAIYAEQLANADVSVEHRDYEGVIHGFFHLPEKIDAGRKCIKYVGKQLAEALVVENN